MRKISIKQIQTTTEHIPLDYQYSFHNHPYFSQLAPVLAPYLSLKEDQEATLFGEIDSTLPEEGYRIIRNHQSTTIYYASFHGCLYGLITLFLLKREGLLNWTELTDYPDMKIRGFMMDISRNKIPSMKTLKQFINQMMLLKYNHLELYIEGFSYQYDKYTQLPYETPLTKEEFQELEEYCLQRGIDLVGNMNGLGHMTDWLKLDKFHPLAECEEGFEMWGFPFPASTLNPLDPKSLAFVKSLYDELLPYSKSSYFNMNMDEPFELGRGKSKESCLQMGREKVYLDYVSKVSEHVKQYGKTPLIWADVLIHQTTIPQDMPKDLIYIDWGYDYDYPFFEHAKKLHQAAYPFLLAPGTSSWNSFASRLKDMYTTTANACQAITMYHGLGLIQTDWGDFGHLQYLPFSYPGLVYAGMASWGYIEPESFDMTYYMNIYLLDEELSILDAIHQLAKLSLLESEYLHNQTMLFSTFQFVDPDPTHPIQLKQHVLFSEVQKRLLTEESKAKIKTVLQSVKNQVEHFTSTSALEVKQTILFLEVALNVNDKIKNQTPFTIEDISAIDDLIENHKHLWLERNRPGGLNQSLSRLYGLKSIIQSVIESYPML